MTTRKMEETRYLGEFGRSDLMGREASAFIREHPAEFARLGLVKAWELWKPGSRRVGRVENLVYALSAVPLLILGLASVLARERSAFERSFAVFGLGLFTVMHMVYTAIVRYRVPADALLIVYAAVLLTDLRARRGRLS
jgi:hypothetical protein